SPVSHYFTGVRFSSLFYSRPVPDAARSPRLLFYGYGAPRDLHSFPTRRSSDLAQLTTENDDFAGNVGCRMYWDSGRSMEIDIPRSEEHTSELQSRENLVCRLLLEKKNDQTEARSGPHGVRDRRHKHGACGSLGR